MGLSEPQLDALKSPTMRDLFVETLRILTNSFKRIERAVSPPKLVPAQGTLAFRYQEQRLDQAIVQKLARIVSGLGACLALIDRGFTQELAVLQRTLDEFIEDVNSPLSGGNPSDHIEVHRTIEKAYSGFVHGASPQIMDMVGGNPPFFHVSGLLNTPRIEEARDDLWNYFYRAIHSIGIASISLRLNEVTEETMVFLTYFENRSGRKPSALRSAPLT